MWIECYAYEEAFGEKVRALGERTRPRDLYDVVNLYRHGDTRPSAAVLRVTSRHKSAKESRHIPTSAAVAEKRPEGLFSVGHFAAVFGARSGFFFGVGPTFGSRYDGPLISRQ